MSENSSAKLSRISPKTSANVRVIGKIRGYTDKEFEAVGKGKDPWITITKGQENGRYAVLFHTQSTRSKDAYQLDDCYEQDEGIDSIYSRDVKPLVLGAFEGKNASLIALGARGSGKSYTMQGSREKPGLAVVAMSEIMDKARESRKFVSVSIYELTQEHAYDVLNPNHSEVQVLEDGRGKINLKGLSQVVVKSISEFFDVYFSQGHLWSTHRSSKDHARSHKGLIVNISSEDCSIKNRLETKLHFVDLAGYEDSRKVGDAITSAMKSKSNKAFYALLNVVKAIRKDELRVPYRESNLTRIMKDSLGGSSSTLLLTCLNPFFCQDTLNSVSLVSQSFHISKKILKNSTNTQVCTSMKKLSSSKHFKAKYPLITQKKIGQSNLRFAKKPTCISKERDHLHKEPKNGNIQKLEPIYEESGITSTAFSSEVQGKPVSECSTTGDLDAELQDTGSLKSELVQDMPTSSHTASTVDILKKELPVMPAISSNAEDRVHFEIANLEDENNKVGLFERDNMSPPLSERIREVSNNLKSLCKSSLLTKKSVQTLPVPFNMEPKTPYVDHNSTRECSPRATFSIHSSCVKQRVVQEYLSFFNSANKDELKKLKGIGEKRASYIIERREESPEPFKSLDDLQDIGLSAKQVKGLMKQVAADIFDH